MFILNSIPLLMFIETKFWLEFQFGINGNRPVSKFSKAGNRKNKHKISLHMKLVKAVKLLLPHTPAINACERLEIVYKFEWPVASVKLEEN